MKLINWIKCWLGLHAFYRIKKLSHQSEKLGCKNCSGQWGLNHPTKSLVEWDEDLEFLHCDDIQNCGCDGYWSSK